MSYQGRFGWILAVVVAGVAGTGTASGGPPASLSIDRLIAGMVGLDERYDPAKHSFMIQYREDTSFHEEDGNAAPESGRWVDSTFARKGSMLYRHVVTKLARNAVPEDEYIVWRDNVCVQRKRNGINILPYMLIQARNNTALTNALGINVYRGMSWTSPSEGAEHPFATSLMEEYFWLLPQIVTDNRKKYRLRPALEDVDGDWCHVLEWPGHDVIWVDAQRGFVPRKRAFSVDGTLINDMKSDQPRQVRPGLWLPENIEVKRYYSPFEKGPKFANKVKFTDKVRLLKVRYDDLPDDFFNVPMKDDENILIADSVRKMTYIRHAKGHDPVAEALEDINASRPLPSQRVWLLVNAVVLASVSAAFMARRLTRGSEPPRPPVSDSPSSGVNP